MERLCPRCKVTKPLEQYGFRNRCKGTRCNFCKACESTRAREYYAAHHDLALAKQNARQRQQRAARKAAEQGEQKT